MKKMTRTLFFMGIILAFASCTWESPEHVSVTTNAEYNFSLGRFEQQLDEEMGMEAMMADTGEGNDDIITLDYFPGKADKNVQHFLLEIKVRDEKLLDKQTGAGASSFDLSNGTAQPVNEKIGLDFNPATLFTGMEEALGTELAGKIIFSDIPMYFYIDIADGVSALGNFEMFYASKNDVNDERAGTRTTILNERINNTPKPAYEKEEEIVITDLNRRAYAAKADITNMINKRNSSGVAFTSVTDDDQLCIEYTIDNYQGTIDASQHDINLKIYAVIDLPLNFKVIDNDLNLDLNKMTGEESSSESNGQTKTSSGDDEFSKYLQVIDSITIRYVAYQLPIFSKSGIKLGIDIIGDGSYQYAPITIVDKKKPLEDSDKNAISIQQKNIIKMKDTESFDPHIQLQLLKDTVFSIPREKGVDVRIELNLTTDGTVQVN